MKYFINIILIVSIGLLVFNATQLDFNDIFGKESSTALIGVLSCLCAIVAMLILSVSRKIQRKYKEKA